eukprot:5860269-Prymnesium_polylepis.1
MTAGQPRCTRKEQRHRFVRNMCSESARVRQGCGNLQRFKEDPAVHMAVLREAAQPTLHRIVIKCSGTLEELVEVAAQAILLFNQRLEEPVSHHAMISTLHCEPRPCRKGPTVGLKRFASCLAPQPET